MRALFLCLLLVSCQTLVPTARSVEAEQDLATLKTNTKKIARQLAYSKTTKDYYKTAANAVGELQRTEWRFHQTVEGLRACEAELQKPNYKWPFFSLLAGVILLGLVSIRKLL